MNRTGIEWVRGPNGEPGYTWNPVTGCLHGCSYCYARRFAERGMGEYGKHPKGERFLPRFHPERLDEPAKVKKPSRIFVCSMADIFSPGVHWEWLTRVLVAREQALQHIYIWLTKAAWQYHNWPWHENDWIGVTVARQETLDLALVGLRRAPLMGQPGVRFISFEPLLGPITLPDEAADILDWIIIGAQTGPGSCQPSYERIKTIVDFAEDHGIPVFIKNNIVEWPLMRHEYPEVVG